MQTRILASCRSLAALGMTVALAGASASGQVPGLTGTIVVTNKSPSTATIIDVGSGRALATIPTGNGPHEVVLSSDGTWAVVTDSGGAPRRTLSVISLPLQRRMRVVDLGQYTAPHGIVFLPGDSLVAVTSETTDNVVIVNQLTAEVRRAVATQGRLPHMVGVTADGARAYTGNMSAHTVSQLDLKSGAFVQSWPVPNTPEAINVTPDGKEVWVGSNATGKVSVIDVATGTITTAAEGLGWPYRVLYSPDAKTVYLPDLRKEELRFLDRATKRELGRIAFPGGAPQGITVTPDGRYVLQSLSAQARVAIIDAASRVVVGYLAAGNTPDGIAYTPRGFNAPLPPSTSKPEDVASIDAIVAALYDAISGPAGQKRDWDRFRGLFAPGARLIPTARRAYDSTRVMRSMSPEEYAVMVGPQLEANGFFEREIGRQTHSFGNIAQVFSAYDSKRLPTDARPFARGINSIQLLNDGKRWWVVTVFWEGERPDNPIPAQFLKQP